MLRMRHPAKVEITEGRDLDRRRRVIQWVEVVNVAGSRIGTSPSRTNEIGNRLSWSNGSSRTPHAPRTTPFAHAGYTPDMIGPLSKMGTMPSPDMPNILMLQAVVVAIRNSIRP